MEQEVASSCPDCEKALVQHPWGGYRLGCVSCAARMASHSPAHHASRQAGRILPEYRTILGAVGAPTIEQAHQLVKGWAERYREKA